MPEVVGNEWSGENVANQRDGDDSDEPSIVCPVVLKREKCDELSAKNSDAGNRNEGKLKTYIMQVERIDTEHDEEGNSARVGGWAVAKS